MRSRIRSSTFSTGGRAARRRARALYQQGRSYELLGSWKPGVASFQLAYQAELY